ncbi:hypothetical protein [Homoserinimonas hongtaonis]|uniref:Uncharacterized protein n=1 Tax=Homoserinimonas hongtaonis TaxID=2079791 RepID=A0A2U1T0W0_9MICO|nr:hypothetical protein [Salinibacterium hongtaonis]AWB89950.1 hypothetical protein C2138_10745 [Salinibacterium hongtaonis]PWB97413.1 hypothetical protein DF220_05920 [Salinibacterium hongtaonis]
MSDNTSDTNDPTVRLDFTDEKWTTAPTPPPRTRRPVRMSTVVWGVILLGLAALFVTARVVDPNIVDGWTALAWGGLGLGLILIVGGIAAASRRSS